MTTGKVRAGVHRLLYRYMFYMRLKLKTSQFILVIHI